MSDCPAAGSSAGMILNHDAEKGMKLFMTQAGEAISIIKTLGPAGACRLIRDTLFSLNHYYVLGRTLAAPSTVRHPRMPDFPFVLADDSILRTVRKQVETLDPLDRRELLGRLRFHACGFSNCYVMKDGDEIAYLQWIIFPHENDIIRSTFSGKFYPLSAKQVMVENVFTFPRFRGRGLLPHGTQQLLDIARNKGYASVICYIRKDNITSLNEFCKMGFKIMRLVKEYKLCGRVWRTL